MRPGIQVLVTTGNFLGNSTANYLQNGDTVVFISTLLYPWRMNLNFTDTGSDIYDMGYILSN